GVGQATRGKVPELFEGGCSGHRHSKKGAPLRRQTHQFICPCDSEAVTVRVYYYSFQPSVSAAPKPQTSFQLRRFLLMLSFEDIGEFIYENYIRPARENGEKAVTIDVREVCIAFNHTYTADLIRSVLGSMKFRNTYSLPLAATGGPPDGL